MSGPLRSKQGCWTCRLRKKKCDEGRPNCSTCESLSITCYGFGAKPDWMDNSEKEKAVVNSLKETVKRTSRRKATTQYSKQPGPIITIAPKHSNGSIQNFSFGSGSTHQDCVTTLLDHESSQENGVNVLQNESTDPPSPERGDLISGSMFSIPADDSALLMHFLDNVFPLQYPMYNPGISEGGRGWLLALLLRTKPLYHAALALSVYHRRIILFAKTHHSCRAATLLQQEKHLEICIKLLNQLTQNSCPSNRRGTVTSVIQLGFFELFTGHGNTWQPHFRAAMNMYQKAYKDNLVHFGLADKSRAILCEDLPLSEYEPVVVEEVVNFRFLAGTIIWLDITSSITAGTRPHLLPYHSFVIASNSQTKLEDIMGCKNWVMLQIGRIAALHEHKTQALQQGHFDRPEFEQSVDDISREIQCGFTQGALEGFDISECDSTTTLNTISDPLMFVTHIFAYMASLYLHLVAHGFGELEVLNTAISGAMRMLQTRISMHLLPALVCPLFVIGSVARREDEQFFRKVFSSPPLLDPLLKHRGRILPILEEIWRRRQIMPGFTWKDSLELTHDIMLL
ncbi:hypothetical protein B7463_g3968, partial [Scytalidium lignicola]